MMHNSTVIAILISHLYGWWVSVAVRHVADPQKVCIKGSKSLSQLWALADLVGKFVNVKGERLSLSLKSTLTG